MKIFTGKVVSTKMNKAATVVIERYRKHPLYGKILRRSTKIHVFNNLEAKEGDMVEIVETRPRSKTVNFQIKTILKTESVVAPGAVKQEKKITKTAGKRKAKSKPAAKEEEK